MQKQNTQQLIWMNLALRDISDALFMVQSGDQIKIAQFD